MYLVEAIAFQLSAPNMAPLALVRNRFAAISHCSPTPPSLSRAWRAVSMI